jgi:hypothetical protein
MTERRRLVLRELERQADQLSAALAVEQSRNARLRRECAAHAHMADAMASLQWTPLQKRRFAAPSFSRAPSSSRVLSSSAMAVAGLDATTEGVDPPQGADADGAESAAAAQTNQGVYGVPAFANALHKSFRRLRAAAERVCGGGGGGGSSKGRGGAASVAAAAAADALAAKVDSLFLDGPAPADASDDGPPRLIFLHDERDRRIFEDSAAGEMSRIGSGVIATAKAGASRGDEGGGRSEGDDDGGGGSSGDDGGGAGGLQVAAASAAVAAPTSASVARGATATANAAGTNAVGSDVGGRSRSVGGRASAATPAATAAASLGWEERCIRAKNMSIRAACEVMVGINARISLAVHQLAEERAREEEEEEEEQQQGDDSGDEDNDQTPADAARGELRAAALDWSTWNGAIFHANEILAEWLCECNLLKRAPDAALSDDVAGTRRRALKALASAKPSREQVELLADAHMLFRKASAPGLEAWRAAADELKEVMEGGVYEQLEAAIDRLEKAVADTAAARGAMSIVVFRVLRLEQISLVALGFFPCTLRVSPLTEAAWTMARQNGWGVE